MSRQHFVDSLQFPLHLAASVAPNLVPPKARMNSAGISFTANYPGRFFHGESMSKLLKPGRRCTVVGIGASAGGLDHP
jgi:hypothetical protein